MFNHLCKQFYSQSASDMCALLYWLVAFFEALMIAGEGSHLKQGSRPAIFIVIIDDRVPSRAKLFLVLVLFSPTTENSLHLHGSGAAQGSALQRWQASGTGLPLSPVKNEPRTQWK